MKHMLWLLKWFLKVGIFFTLFAFALNNQQDTTVNFFFGKSWHAPQVLLVLGAFTAGVVVGVLGMLPRWVSHQVAKTAAVQPAPTTATPPAAGAPSYADGL